MDAWDAELDAFEARIEEVEAGLAGGEWPSAVPWAVPEALDEMPPDPAQAVRLRELTVRADAARVALRGALAEVGNEIGMSRRQRSAARHYVRADVVR